MLLNDIGTMPNATFRKINQHLENNYGFKIAEDVSDKDLVSIMEQIEDEIVDLKIQGGDAKASPEISKRLLILEGIRQLREFALVQFQSPDLEKVIHGLSDYVHDAFRLSGTTHQDFDECVKDGMKHYRSSKYRFPDDMIEQRVRQAAMSKIHGVDEGMIGGAVGGAAGGALGAAAGTALGGPVGAALGDVVGTGLGAEVGDNMTDEEFDQPTINTIVSEKSHEARADMVNSITKLSADIKKKLKSGQTATPAEIKALNAMKKKHSELEEGGDKWAGVGKRASAIGGHTMQAPNTGAAKAAMKKLDNPKLSLVSEPELDNKDPFAARKAALAKGTKPTIEENDSKDSSSWDLEPIDTKKTEYKGPQKSQKDDAWTQNKKDLNKGRQPTIEGKKIMKENLVKNLRRLLETEVSQAEVMMSSKEFALELQEMIEKIGRLQNEDLPPVTDQMRETYGTASSSAFQTQIYSAFQGVMDALYTAKSQVDDAVSSMATTGQVGMSNDMDKDVGGMDADMVADMDMGDADLDIDNIGADLDAGADAGDDFGGAEGEEPLGRAMKTESLQRKVEQMKHLVEKAKKLKESKKK